MRRVRWNIYLDQLPRFKVCSQGWNVTQNVSSWRRRTGGSRGGDGRHVRYMVQCSVYWLARFELFFMFRIVFSCRVGRESEEVFRFAYGDLGFEGCMIMRCLGSRYCGRARSDYGRNCFRAAYGGHQESVACLLSFVGYLRRASCDARRSR